MAVKNTSPLELSAVSTESCTTPMMKPMATACIATSLPMPKKEQAAVVGEKIAKLAVEAGISEVVFDRNGYLYHGRVQELANGARKGGLKF